MVIHILKIESISNITHDVLRIVTDKPAALEFKPGQACKLAIHHRGVKTASRPFTFTGLPENSTLEFTIKTYPGHKGVTNAMLQLKPNDELMLYPVFGAIAYKGEGVFIAGGAGVTPFISIFRDLEVKHKIGNNKLLFANKTKADIILEDEFTALLGKAFVNILSDEEIEGYRFGMIDQAFLKANVTDFKLPFYLCGPPPMVKALESMLSDLGVRKDQIIKETL